MRQQGQQESSNTKHGLQTKVIKARSSPHFHMITNLGSSKQPQTSYLDTTRSPLGIDISQYVGEFNKDQDKLEDISKKVCEEIDRKFPRFKYGDRALESSRENMNWAKSLILCGWLGWILNSKAIWHEGKRNPQEAELLNSAVIPSVMTAFQQGIAKAMRDKIREGKNPY